MSRSRRTTRNQLDRTPYTLFIAGSLRESPKRIFILTSEMSLRVIHCIAKRLPKSFRPIARYCFFCLYFLICLFICSLAYIATLFGE